MEGEAIFVLDETFDDLVAQAVESPSDEQAFDALRSHFSEVEASGQIDKVMEMSMVLGATACMHSHLEGLANEVGEQYVAKEGSGSDGNHDHSHNVESSEKSDHNTHECTKCQKGEYCANRK